MKKAFHSVAIAAKALINIIAQSFYTTRTGQATIFSHTDAENITATNNSVTIVINTVSREIAISIPVQSLTFEIALMQEHFNNSNLMDFRQFSRMTLKVKITNLSAIGFSKSGKYDATI